tara:strand:- start:147 stop:677 length:531 start_codon:yes stop_codon:yes gene_type:complete
MSDIKKEIEKLMKDTNEITVSIYDVKRKAPFIATHPTFFDNGAFYILSSELARQTHYYEIGSKISAIIINEVTVKGNLYSRKRITMECEVKKLEKNEYVRSLFENQLGIFSSGLFDVDDFKLFEIKPLNGLYFRGFGRAYEFVSDCVETIHVKEPHKPKEGNTMAKILRKSLITEK